MNDIAKTPTQFSRMVNDHREIHGRVLVSMSETGSRQSAKCSSCEWTCEYRESKTKPSRIVACASMPGYRAAHIPLAPRPPENRERDLSKYVVQQYLIKRCRVPHDKIVEWFGPPDVLGPNSKNPMMPIHYYLRSRVDKVTSSFEFKRWQASRNLRRRG